MLISVNDLVKIFKICPSSVLHVGANEMEEEEEYLKNGFTPVTWVECNPSTIELLKRKINGPNKLIEACISNENGKKVTFYQAGASSSIFKRKGHQKRYPEIKFNQSICLTTTRLDKIFNSKSMPDFVNIDIEGAEYAAIESLGDLIENIKYIYVEVNKKYWGENPDFRQISRLLSRKGFYRMGIKWYWDAGFGDAVFSKERPSPATRIAIFSYLAKWNLKRFKNNLKITYYKFLSKKDYV